MTDSEFIERINSTLSQVEQYIENLVDATDIDADCARSGNVLTIDLEQYGKLILNSQVANHELWLAAKSGGFHYKVDNSGWVDTRSGRRFHEHFISILQSQLGECGKACPPMPE